ncbi:MAG: toll/interleukin-1 receptor domain-containing protein [Candidatus Eisenbacteria bacterium]|nr:toll/interleukin-1 receptor domain-containing protein [Candidatus Eisenbacteria bacterium]
MATLPIEIISVGHATRKSLCDAATLLNAHQDAYSFTILDVPAAEAFRGDSPHHFTTAEVFEYLEGQKRLLKGYHPHLVGFVERRLDGSKWGNLFGSAHEDSEGNLTGIGAVTFFQVPELFGKVPETVYGVYQLLSLSIRFTVGKGMIHQERRMCFFDFKRQKADLLEIIQKGELCPICAERLREYIDDDQLVAIRSTLKLMSQVALAEDPGQELNQFITRAQWLPKLFLSHASEDKPFVEKLAFDLEQHGCRVWFDKWAIKGADFVKKIEEGLQASDHFAIVISPSSVISPWVAQERNIAIVLATEGRTLQLLVIILKDAEIPTFLRVYDPIDFRNHAEPGEYQQALDKLRRAMRLAAPDEPQPTKEIDEQSAGPDS